MKVQQGTGTRDKVKSEPSSKNVEVKEVLTSSFYVPLCHASLCCSRMLLRWFLGCERAMLLGGCAAQTMYELLLGYPMPTESIIHLKTVVLLVLHFCYGPGTGLDFVVRGLL